MKHFVTALLFCSVLAIGTGVAFGQSVVRAPKPASATASERTAPAPFLHWFGTASAFEGSGSTKDNPNEILANYETEEDYYYVDTNLISYSSMDTTMGQNGDTNTYYGHGFVEHISTSLAHPVLDSAQIVVQVDTIPSTNRLMIEAVLMTDQLTTAQTLLPFVDLSHAGDTSVFKAVTYAGTNLKVRGYKSFTIKFSGVDFTKNNAGSEFGIFVDRTGDMTYGATSLSTFDADLVKEGAAVGANHVNSTCDQNLQPIRAIDSTVDRLLELSFNYGQSYYTQHYVAGLPAFDSTGNNILDANGDTLYFYSNMIVNAWLHDPTVNAGVAESSSQPSQFRIAQNYPNPVTAGTSINYALPVASDVSIRVYNVLGQEVQTLVNSHQAQGEHSVTYVPVGLPSGSYYYTMTAGNFKQTRQMVIAR